MTQTEIGMAVETHTATRAMEAPVAGIPNVEHLMEMALGQGEGGVAALERLVALQERVMTRQAENDLSHALAEFQAECPPIRQTKKASIATKGGGAYSFTYAPLDEVARVIKPHLRKHRLNYTFDSVLDGATMTVTCTVRHANGASVSGQFTCPTESNSGASAQQKTGIAHTYAKRQALASALGLITTNADADAAGSFASSEPITEKECATIRALIKQKGADIDRVLAFADEVSLAAISTEKYGMVVRMLEAKKDAEDDV